MMMSRRIKEVNDWTKLVIVLSLLCSAFGVGVNAQTDSNKALNAQQLANLKTGLAQAVQENLPIASAQTTGKPAGNSIDKGDFKIGFSPATLKKNPKKAMDKELADSLVEITKPLNEIIALPYNVYLNFDQCGEPNAFYNPEVKEITMCYEFLEDFEKAFKQISKNPKEVDNMTEGAMAVFFFHELGHYLIDAWDLPATGREEDAVDQLAMFVLLDGTPEGEDMVLSAATFFAVVSDGQNNDELAFWNEHSLDQQRFYDMLCLTYGSNPSKNKHLLGKNGLPNDRADRCPAEFQRVNHSWEKLLAPYLKS